MSSVKEKLGDKFGENTIKDLTIIDIDTLIYWLPHLCEGDHNLRHILDDHLKKMTTRKVKPANPEVARKAIANQLAPISNRFHKYKFPMKLLMKRFEPVLKKDHV